MLHPKNSKSVGHMLFFNAVMLITEVIFAIFYWKSKKYYHGHRYGFDPCEQLQKILFDSLAYGPILSIMFSTEPSY